MTSHQDRVRDNYEQQPDSTGTTTARVVIMETDVRKVLDFMDAQYTNDDLRQAVRRLRAWVGYQG